MRVRFSVSLCAVVLLAGCASTGGMASSNEATVRSIYDAFARGDGAAVLGTFDPRIEWNEAESFHYADGNPYLGPQAVAEGVFGRVMGDIESFQASPTDFVVENDTVVVLGRYRGSGRVTGLPLDAQFVHVWRLRNGKVISFQQYTDTEQFNRVLGS
jgi:uncharacterized protein